MKRYFLISLICINSLAAYPNKEHIVERGETIESIATKYNIDVEMIVNHNPSVAELFYTGMSIVIPDGKNDDLSANKSLSTNTSLESTKQTVDNDKNALYSTSITVAEKKSADYYLPTYDQVRISGSEGHLNSDNENIFKNLINKSKDVDYRNAKTNKNNKKLFKALALMQSGKIEKAVDEMEKIAGGNYNSIEAKQEACYQLLFFKQFGTFDYKNSHNYLINPKIISANTFPTNYTLKDRNLKKQFSKDISIEDCDKKIQVSLLPFTGNFSKGLAEHIFDYSHDQSYYKTILKEFDFRLRNGIVTSKKVAFGKPYLYSNPIHRTVSFYTLMPYLKSVLDEKSVYLRSANEIYNIGESIVKKHGKSMNYDAIFYFCLAALKGDSRGVPSIVEYASKVYAPNGKIDSSTDAKSLMAIIDDVIETKEFNVYKTALTEMNGRIGKVKMNLAEREDKIRQQRLAEERERKRIESVRKQQMWAGIAQVALGAIGNALDTYAQVKTAKAVGSSGKYNGYSGTSYGRVGSLAAQMEQPGYFQNVQQQLMQISMQQVYEQDQREYQAMRQNYLNIGKDLSYMEYCMIKGQAIQDMKNEGYDTSTNQNTTTESNKPSSNVPDKKKNSCGVCGGKGYIVKTVANFGITNERWCEECGRTVINGHYHETCNVCKGKKFF